MENQENSHRPWWFWLLILLIIGVAVYLILRFLVFGRDQAVLPGTSPTQTPIPTQEFEPSPTSFITPSPRLSPSPTLFQTPETGI